MSPEVTQDPAHSSVGGTGVVDLRFLLVETALSGIAVRILLPTDLDTVTREDPVDLSDLVSLSLLVELNRILAD